MLVFSGDIREDFIKLSYSKKKGSTLRNMRRMNTPAESTEKDWASEK